MISALPLHAQPHLIEVCSIGPCGECQSGLPCSSPYFLLLKHSCQGYAPDVRERARRRWADVQHQGDCFVQGGTLAARCPARSLAAAWELRSRHVCFCLAPSSLDLFVFVGNDKSRRRLENSCIPLMRIGARATCWRPNIPAARQPQSVEN